MYYTLDKHASGCYLGDMKKLLIAVLIAASLAGCFDSFGGRGHGWAPVHCNHGHCWR